jgi:hypothetical protein
MWAADNQVLQSKLLGFGVDDVNRKHVLSR